MHLAGVLRGRARLSLFGAPVVPEAKERRQLDTRKEREHSRERAPCTAGVKRRETAGTRVVEGGMFHYELDCVDHKAKPHDSDRGEIAIVCPKAMRPCNLD